MVYVQQYLAASELCDYFLREDKMILKPVTVLAIAAACYAIPIEEALKPEGPSQPTIVASPENVRKPELIAVPMEEKPINPELMTLPAKVPVENADLISVPVPADTKVPAKPVDDLKTDNTFWWSRYYRYPAYSSSRYYYNYHYVPRTYTYYETVPSTYTYWRTYW